MGERINASMQSVSPDDLPPVKRFVIGVWTCECGTISHHATRPSAVAFSVNVYCPYCGDSAEVFHPSIDDARED